MKMPHKRTPESENKRNQRTALKWYISITAYHDSQKQEIVNTCTEQDNAWFLNETFGVVDSGVSPSYAFDGCVLEDGYGRGALQQE
jgi:hypothetical protein